MRCLKGNISRPSNIISHKHIPTVHEALKRPPETSPAKTNGRTSTKTG